MKGYEKFIKYIHYGGDVVLLMMSYIVGNFLTYSRLTGCFDEDNLILFFFMLIAWTFSIRNLNVFSINRVTQIHTMIGSTFSAIVLNSVAMFVLLMLLTKYDVSEKWILFTYMCFYVLVMAWRVLFFKLLKLYRSKEFSYRKTAIVGAGPVGVEMKNYFNSDFSYGYKFTGFFDDDSGSCNPEYYLGPIEDIEAYMIAKKIDEIYCALPDYAYLKVQNIMKLCDKYGVRFKVIPDFRKFSRRRVYMDFYGNVPVIHQRIEPLQSAANRLKKRLFDIVFSLSVILLIFPWLYPIIAILIKTSSKGPVLFLQDRTGINNQTFKCFKFRTMKVMENKEFTQATKNDPRVTKIGAFLRKSNLDELPQFFNVLVGNMSIVGPRPHPLALTMQYYEIIDKYMVRHLCKPGITGWAQVNGYRGETKEPKLMEKRVLYDIWYLERWSFWFDMRIVFLTVKNMVKGEENAY